MLAVAATLFAGWMPVSAAEEARGISWMCVGDSITYGNKVPGGYRAPLYQLYQQAGINVRMVGPNSANNGTELPDGSGHAGYGGYYIRQISNKIISWLESYQPQVVSLQIGTNDILQNNTEKFPDDKRETAPDRLSDLIDKITSTLPDAEIFVAKIPPLNSAGYNPHIINYNDAIEDVIESKGSKVHLVDNYTALEDDLTANLQSDGIHPTLTGYEKMAQSWFDASESIVSQLTPTEPLNLMPTSRTGKYLLHLESPGTGSFKNIAASEITIEEDTDYEVSFYTKGTTGTTIFAKIITTDWKDIKTGTYENGPAWSKCTFQFNSGTNTKVRFAIFDNSTTAGDIYIDDCSVVKVGSAEELLRNPGFELQATNWDIKAPFAVIQSMDVLTPPASVESTDQPVAKTIDITMDEFTEKNLPTDISCTVLPNQLYTEPDKITSGYITSNSGIFYHGSDGSGSIMLNPNGSSQVPRFGLDKAGYNDVTGFDEVRIKFKAMKVEGWPDDDYKAANEYKLEVGLGHYNGQGNVSGTTLTNSNRVAIIPSAFHTLDDGVYEEAVLKRADFSTGALDVEGNLKAYQDEDGNNHYMMLTFWLPSRVGWLIDEIEFIWYNNEPNAEVTEINFTNDEENINAYGLRTGVNTATLDLYNPTTANLENAQYILALRNKQTGVLEDFRITPFSIRGKETVSDLSLSVTVPDGANPENYEAQIILLKGFDSMKPILVSSYRFDGSGEVTQ